MEDGFPKKRNVRPVEKSNLPLITLFVLVLLVLAMLYVGYEYISDSSSNSEELTSTVVDSIATEDPKTVGQITDEPVAEEASVKEEKPAKVEKEESKKPEPEKEKTPIVSAASIGGEQITHDVKSGETFSSIAARYNLKTETLKGLNASVTDVKSGTTKLKVQVKAIHTVGPGDVLRVVAEKYGVTKAALMKANGKTKDFSERGEKLIIPFPDKK
jgi:LysM repeat protein